MTFTYDRRGRKSTAGWSGITATMAWNDADMQESESYSSGSILSLLSMNSAYDSNLRRTTLEAKQNTTSLQSVGYAYDYAGRFATVTDNSASSYTANYAYQANSMLVSSISFKHGVTNMLVTSKTYDLLNRLTSISSAAFGSKLPISFQYDYNSANQRIRCTLEDGSFWVYMYDSLGQVTSGKRYWADGTPVDGQQFEYSFDDIGNRITTGGRASAASTYTRTSTNAYTQRTVAGYTDVLGIANPTASVTVNGNTANRHGEYFHYPLTIANSSAAVYQSITNTSSYGSGQTVTGKVFVPAATETFTHDQDGNLTADGRWAYTWDGENRLIQMIRDTDSPSGAREKLVFDYDWMGRRIRKRFYTYSGGYSLQTDTIFLYDGWNLICEFDASSSQPGALVRSYIWGPDLSGTMQGAGGVGGLLKVTDAPLGSATHSFVAYDGNGNVAALVDAGTGAINARYEYGPFAEPVRTVGTMAKKMPFRFSTKYTDNESGLIYYGYRYYNPSTGRWVSRDQIEELGGLNMFGLVGNDAVSKWDYLGLVTLSYDSERPIEGECGVFSLKIKWKVEGQTANGWVEQKITSTETHTDCGTGRVIYQSPPDITTNFREFFDMRMDGGGSNDTDNWANHEKNLSCTSGRIEITGEAYFSYGKLPPNVRPIGEIFDNPEFPIIRSHPAGTLPVARPENPVLSRNSNTITRKLTATWDCCVGDGKTKVTIE